MLSHFYVQLSLETFDGGLQYLVVASGRLVDLNYSNCPKKQEKLDGSCRSLRHGASTFDGGLQYLVVAAGRLVMSILN